jgi:prepilin signal peptidase PulO-like enzyme (type II secretory pathway)
VASLLIAWYKKDAFGGGDIKLLAALGAWLGAEGVLYVMVTASVLGVLYAWCCHQKQVAFGPMLALAGIAVAFVLF